MNLREEKVDNMSGTVGDLLAQLLDQAMGHRCSMCGGTLKGHSFAPFAAVAADDSAYADLRSAYYGRDWARVRLFQAEATTRDMFAVCIFSCPKKNVQMLMVRVPVARDEQTIVVDRTSLAPSEVAEACDTAQMRNLV